jgi:hypothetical protein
MIIGLNIRLKWTFWPGLHTLLFPFRFLFLFLPTAAAAKIAAAEAAAIAS